MRAQVISIGSELILGHLTDTNATYLAQELAGLGIELTLVTQVGDDLERLTSVIARGIADAEVVICTGGIGPTADDLTREAIATVVGEQPEIQPDLLETLQAFFRSRGIEMPERNRKQAWLIPSAEALPNPVGTAPGWFVRQDGHAIAAMPGVPREMFRMWREQVVPRLFSSGSGRSVQSITFRTIGIGESAAEQLLHDLVAIENPVVATYAKDDGVHVRITATAPTTEQAARLRDDAASEVLDRLRSHIYSSDGTTLPQSILNAARGLGLKIAISDAGGAGRFACLLGSDPSSIDVVESAVTRPSSLGLTAQDLAHSVLDSRSTRLGVGIVVEVAPVGDEVYEGTIHAAIAGRIEESETMPMKSGFEDIQRRSALFAADVLRRAMLTQSN